MNKKDEEMYTKICPACGLRVKFYVYYGLYAVSCNYCKEEIKL